MLPVLTGLNVISVMNGIIIMALRTKITAIAYIAMIVSLAMMAVLAVSLITEIRKMAESYVIAENTAIAEMAVFNGNGHKGCNICHLLYLIQWFKLFI